MAGEVAPHIAFPPRVVGTAFLTVEQGSPQHVVQCAEVLLRTEAGTFEHDPDLGRRDLVGSTPPIADDLIEALERHVPEGRFGVRENLDRIAERIVSLRVELDQED